MWNFFAIHAAIAGSNKNAILIFSVYWIKYCFMRLFALLLL